MQEKPRRWWLQFSLRGLMVGMLSLGAGLGAFAWWRTPFLYHRTLHRNGVAKEEIWCRRNFGAEPSLHSKVFYYGTGQKGAEQFVRSGQGNYWSPEGEPITWGEWVPYYLTDKGDGTFRKRDW